MKKTENVILDFSHVYPENIETQVEDLTRVDLSDISGTNMYCTKEAEDEIRNRLKDFGPEGIHFLDNGNYHYVTKIFLDKIKEPFSLVLFDYHNDMQIPIIHDLISCGSWAREVLKENHYLQQLILIGPDQKSIDEIDSDIQEKLICISIQELEQHKAKKMAEKIQREFPVYFSIDKDVLNRYAARTNWNQGRMSLDMLEMLLYQICAHQKVIGADIGGECSTQEPFNELICDKSINEATNEVLYRFFRNVLDTLR